MFGFFVKKKAFQAGELSKDRINKFKEIGIDTINLKKSQSHRDGFTKWANKVHEIAAFIEENGHYPKAGTDKIQRNLYNSLARTKRALKKNELSDKHIELLNELNIELD